MIYLFFLNTLTISVVFLGLHLDAITKTNDFWMPILVGAIIGIIGEFPSPKKLKAETLKKRPLLKRLANWILKWLNYYSFTVLLVIWGLIGGLPAGYFIKILWGKSNNWFEYTIVAILACSFVIRFLIEIQKAYTSISDEFKE